MAKKRKRKGIIMKMIQMILKMMMKMILRRESHSEAA